MHSREFPRPKPMSSDDFVARMTAHPQVGRFFAGVDTASGSKFRSHLVDFICAATGGGTNYRGRDMASAHRSFDISESDWEVTVAKLKESLLKRAYRHVRFKMWLSSLPL